MIEGVERLGAQLQRPLTAKGHILEDREIQRVDRVEPRVREVRRQGPDIHRELLGRVPVESRNVEGLVDVPRIPVQIAAQIR